MADVFGEDEDDAVVELAVEVVLGPHPGGEEGLIEPVTHGSDGFLDLLLEKVEI